jgi:hypothetical protein
MFVISHGQLIALMEFIGNLEEPWTKTNPVMQMLSQLQEVATFQQAPGIHPQAPAPIQAPQAQALQAAPPVQPPAQPQQVAPLPGNGTPQQ